MRVRYYAHYGSVGGYGRAARDYLAALATVPAVELQIVSLDHRTTTPEPRYAHLDRFVVDHLDDIDPAASATTDVAVYHAPPRVLGTLINSRGLELGTTPCVALTTWETSAIPERVIVQNRLHEFDAMITPSGFCSDAFDHAIAVHAGHARKVHTVPHCYDEHFWQRMNEREFDQDDTLRGCPFYAMGAWGDRKNMLGVLKAYLHAFTRGDNVSLTMILDEKANLDEIRSVLACSMIPQHLMPKISIPPPRELSE